jgi:beta-N-acetylhexosaminidase
VVVLPGLPGTTLDDATAAHLAAGGPGIFLLGHNVTDAETLRALTGAAACSATGPILVAVDQELSPAVQRLRGLVTPPPTPDEAVLAGPDAMLSSAARLAEELLALGVNMDLAPVVDVVTGSNPVLAGRHLGPDPEVVAEIGAAFVEGMAASGVIAVPKHFPGHGRSQTDPHSGAVVIDATPEDLGTIDWIPFHAVFAAGAGAVMVGHPVYTDIDPDHPASLSPTVLTQLRTLFGFDGVAITDSLSMAAVTDGRTPGELGVAALAAGEDLLLVQSPSAVEETVTAIIDAVESGDLPRERLEEAARRVRTLAASAGTVACPG